VAIAHIAVLSAALSALLILPCAATIILTGGTADLRRLLTRHGRDELRAQNGRDRAGTRHLARRHHRRVERGPRGRDDRAYRRLDRSLWDHAARLAALRPPTIEQIAYDLRRLDHQRRSAPVRQSEVCLAAVMTAYDTRLRLACGCLGIQEFLDGLDGVERDIERVRVEGLLESAGLVLRHEPGAAF
jgi:hypothetical protein